MPALSDWWDVALLELRPDPGRLRLRPDRPAALERRAGCSPLAAALGVLAVLAELGDLEVLANFAKLAAVTFFAFWFLRFFEELVLLVIVALIIPWVDAYSVFRGPTGHIVSQALRTCSRT